MTVFLTIVAFTSILMNYGSCSPTTFPFNSDAINVEQAVNYLNKIKGRTWTAGPNNFGNYLKVSQQEHRMGSLIWVDDVNNANNPAVHTAINWDPRDEDNEDTGESHVYSYDEIPDYYDAREMYPHCTTIATVKDQSLCGCCWAVSTASAFSDRLCIHSKGMINVNISINHIMTCAGPSGFFSNGCHGGLEAEAWEFIKNKGAVSGGDYGTFDGCQPFLIKECGDKDEMPCEQVNEVLTPICRKNKCSNEWHQPEGKLYKAKYTWTMPGNITHPNREIDIRREIYLNGPVTAAFKVYWPFYLYKSGIFQDDFSNWPIPGGGHSVRIVGWGVENKIPYWIIANSWGKDWGENGFFRMLRGQNYCRIESYINVGIPDTSLEF